MRIKICTLFLVTFFSIPLFCQPHSQNKPAEFSNRLNSVALNIYEGIGESISWLDIPVVGLMLTKEEMHTSDNTKLFRVTPFPFEKKIASDVGTNGRHSPGGMDQNTIPFFIIYSRLAITLTQNFIDPSSVGKDSYKHIFLFYKSMMYTHTFTELFKNLVDRPRPDRSDTRSFFSGHSSATFSAATFLYREIDDVLDVWHITAHDDFLRTSLKTISFSALYGWAGYVGYSRMMDNKHYLSDVLLGAAAGILMSNLIYNYYLDETESRIFDSIGVGIINETPALSIRIKL